MPEIDAIEQFKKIVNNLGDEPRILEERGESMEDVQPPEESVDEGLDDLINQASEESEAGDLGGEEAPQDMDSLLQEAGEEGGEEEGAGENAAGEDAAGEEEEDIFGDDLFNEIPSAGDEESTEEVGLDDLEEPEEEEGAGGEAAEGEEGADSEEAGGEEQGGGLDEMDLGGLDDLEELADEGLEDIFGEEGAEEGGEGPSGGEFEAGEAGASEETEEPEAAEPEDLGAEEEPAASDEGLEDLEELPDFDEEPEELGGEEEPEELGGEEELPSLEEGEELEEGLGDGMEELETDGFGDQDFGDEEDDLDGLDDMDELDDFTDEEAEEFSLGDFGHEFGITEEAADEGIHGIDEFEPGSGEEEPEEEAELTSVTDDEFVAIQRTLARLPNNLKLIIEDQIGDQELSGEPLKKLVQFLIDGESPKKIADETSKIVGKTIKIPRGYEKSSAAELERKKSGFLYIFVHSVWPKLRTFLVVGTLLWVLFLLGYSFLYRPFMAGSLYREGYEEIQEHRYELGNSLFTEARTIWKSKKWFFRYAQAFIDLRQYGLAAEKYDQLLVYPLLSYEEKEELFEEKQEEWGKDVPYPVAGYPESKRGFLEYADLESRYRADYEKADRILEAYLDRTLYDYDIMLMKGDNYLRWAEEDPSRFEDARKTYAMVLNRYGSENEVLYRMMLYFIRSDGYQGSSNHENIMRLKDFFDAQGETSVNPQAYAELGGYLMERGELQEVREVLFRAKQADDTLPVVHYNMARYFKKVEKGDQEELALRKSLFFLDQNRPHTPRQRHMEIDSYRRMGERLLERGEELSAETFFQEGIDIYEDALSRGMVSRKPVYGKLYADLGDLYYYSGADYDEALTLYFDAEKNGYESPEQSYRKGYIFYQAENPAMAMKAFNTAARAHPENPNALISLANAFYQRRDYFSAQAHYEDLLRVLKHDKELVEYLLPNERDDHKALLENMMKAYNNLGVTYYDLSRRTEDAEKKTRALAMFTESMRVADRLTRDQGTKVRSDAYSLAHVNYESVVYPEGGTEPEIYRALPRDLEQELY